MVEVQALWSLPHKVSGRLNLLFGYQRDPALAPDTYSIGIHLENANGELVQQVDYGLSNEPFSCRWSQLPLDNLAAGEYTVWMMVYQWQTFERMSADSASDDNRVMIGTIMVE